MKGNHCGGFLDRQIGGEPLVINWANEDTKMAKIVRYIHIYCNDSILKSIMQYLFIHINSAEGLLPDDEF